MIMKTNIPPFYGGQKVVCVKEHDDPECGLRLNVVYSVMEIYLCKCGWSVGVGIKDPEFQHEEGVIYCCSTCGEEQHTDSWLLSCKRFIPIQELKAPLLTFEKIQQEEKEEILTLN